MSRSPHGNVTTPSQEDHEEIRPTAEDRDRRASRLLCGDERGRHRRSPGGRSPAQQSRGEFASAVSTTRARHAALSKREDVTENQLSSRAGPQPFQPRAPSDHPPSLQAETLCFIGRVARRRGLNVARGWSCCAMRCRPSVTLTKPLQCLISSRTGRPSSRNRISEAPTKGARRSRCSARSHSCTDTALKNPD